MSVPNAPVQLIEAVSAYDAFFKSVVYGGNRVESRLGPAMELLAGGYGDVAGSIVGRSGLNVRLGILEALQVVAGVYDAISLATVAPRADLSLFTEGGAYGPRIVDQVPEVLRELDSDPTSRRAVLVLARAYETRAELPCTTSIQFLRREVDGRPTVQAVVSMRSWDLWLGLPYDLMVFGLLTQCVARCLGATPGLTVVTAGSAHVYEKHLGGKTTLPERGFVFSDMPDVAEIADAGDRWQSMRLWAAKKIQAAPWDDGLPDGLEILTFERDPAPPCPVHSEGRILH